MSNYIVSCCSTADLTKEHFENRNLAYVCFHYSIDGTMYDDDLGQTISMPDFYQKMVDGAKTRTSQVNVSEYINFFRPFLEKGKDILHVTLSSGISGSYNSANTAKDILSEEFPDRKIYIIDSLAASSGYGLLMDAICDKRDEGMDIDTLKQWILEHRNQLHHWFFSTDLTFYIKGGRVSKTSGVIGNLLNICPLLNVDNKGQLILKEKVRTKKKVIKQIVSKMEEHATGGLDYNGKCYISMSACEEDARAVASLIEEKFPNLHGKVEIYNIGTVIGSHTGPGTVALFFWGDERM